jgi:predicted Fe-Mo cluster-binding NifX family protein
MEIIKYAEINGVIASQDTPGAMSSAADDQVDQAVKQVSEMTLGDKYNPDKVAYEVATFALS